MPAADIPALPGPYRDVSPRWSPDGRRIAFLRRTPDRRHQLYLADAELRRPQPLLEPEMLSHDREYNPSLHRYRSPDTLSFSPDSRHIAFPREEWFTFEDGDKLPGTGLWNLDTKTGSVTPLALHPPDYKEDYYYYRFPQWSPDGKYLAFVGEGMHGERTIFCRTLNAQRADEVPPRFDDYEDGDWPVWKPEDGRRKSEVGRVQHPTPNAQRPTPTLAYRRSIRRSPASPGTETLRRLQPGSSDGRQSGEMWRLRALDYARMLARGQFTLGGGESGGRNAPALVPYPVPGGPLLEAVAPRAGHLAFSPDGRKLAFTLTPDSNDFDRYQLWIIEVETGQARCVCPTGQRGYLAPVWIGNDRLGVLSPKGKKYDVLLIKPITGQTRTLGTIDSADCDWSPDRRFIVYATEMSPRTAGSTTLRILRTAL